MNFLTRLKTEKWTVLFAAFLIPSLTVAGIFAAAGVYPFGDRCILHIDMYHQYAPFFMELLNKLQNGGSPMYSWNIGLGSDFIATYAYYLSSPLNFFLLFCSRSNLIEFMTVLILIKTGLSGLTMASYVRGHFGDKSLRILFPAVFYALSGFFAAYYWDIMWLDPVYLFPLILLGEEKLMKHGKGALYSITLALSIWSNYYISIMICIFIVLWYFLNLGEVPEGIRGKGKSFLRMLLYSLPAAGCAALLILPEIRVLSFSGSAPGGFPDTMEWYFSFADEIGQHLTLAPAFTTEGNLPNLYSGVPAIFLLVLYLMNRRISPGQKVKRAALLAFFLISFNLNFLDFIWHGFHFPEGLPARQAFLYTFLLLITAYEPLLLTDGNRREDLMVSGALGALVIVASGVLGSDENVVLSAAVSGILFLSYLLLYGFYGYGPKHLKKIVVGAALFLSVFETALHFSETEMSTTDRNTYVKNQDAVRTLYAEAKERSDGFFRVEKYERMMKDENLLGSYPAASLFSSLINLDVANAYESAGMEGGKNFYCYNGATPMLSAMLSVRYLLTDSPDEESFLKTLVSEKDGMYLYENTFALPFGFVAPKGLEERWQREGRKDRIEVVNGLGEALGAPEDTMIYQGSASETEEGASFTAERDGYFFAVHGGKGIQSITVEKEGRETTLSKTTHNYFLDLGYLKKGETAELRSSNGEAFPAEVYRISKEALETAYAALNQNALSVTEFSDTRVSGTIDIKEEGDLILSIPAEPGWTVTLDGEETEPERFMDAYIRLPLKKGTHEILLTYQTPGLKGGVLISLLSFSLLVFLLLRETFQTRVNQRENI